MSFFGLFMVFSLMLSACATPTPEVVEKVVEKVVTEVVEVEKEVTRIVAGTPVVEKVIETQVVEKEVTKIVEVEKVVTATPAPKAEKQVLRVAIEGEPMHLSPVHSGHSLVLYCVWPVYDTLLWYSYDGNMDIVGELAESWEWVDDLTFKFTLRPGIKWHDGKPLTTADVKYTVEYSKDPATGSPNAAYLEAVDSVEIVDDLTGIFHLNMPFAPLETYVLERVYIVQDGSGDELKTQMVGTGAFKLKEWVQGEKVVYTKNEDYWKPDKPHLDELVIQFFPVYATMLQSFRAGDTDIITWLKNADAEPLQAEGFEAPGKALYGCFYIAFNAKEPPFDDVRVRQAIKYAVDKDLVLEASQAGLGETVDINWTPDSTWYTPGLEYERDLDKARQLMAEAGYPDGEGFSAKLYAPDTPAEGPICETVAFSVSEAGINLECVKEPVPDFIETRLQEKQYGSLICGYGGVNDPDYFDYRNYHSSGPNRWNIANPEMDALLEEARKPLGIEGRKELYAEFRKIAWEDLVAQVWLINEYRVLAVQPYVKGFKFNKSKCWSYEGVTIEK
jgi:peptide/nickel transport system substrate-binding protein